VRRWLTVGGVGVVCGALLALLFWSLTANALAALIIGAAVAAILVVLAVAGGRYNRTYKLTEDRRAAALAKRERVRKAIEQTREQR
jgi:predicted lysophospholipase L1 biosynthesis ABC-type transport system permease subunit